VILLFTLLAAAVSITPATPTVGDPVTLTFPSSWQEVELESSDEYELVSAEANVVVVRSFKPGELTVEASGRDAAGNALQTPPVVVRVASVLEENDSMKPAPFAPPVDLPRNRAALWSLGTAAAAAALLWGALFAISPAARTEEAAAVPLDAVTAFHASVDEAMQMPPGDPRWIALAEALRTYLAAAAPTLGRELTTRELLGAVSSRHGSDVASLLGSVLRGGDLSKFSPWGAGTAAAEELRARLHELPARLEEER
jgi:hypothetical protein